MYVRVGSFCSDDEQAYVCPLARSFLKSFAEVLVEFTVKFLVQSLVRSLVESRVKSYVCVCMYARVNECMYDLVAFVERLSRYMFVPGQNHL